ncbi:uncharacterized protein Nmag_2986 [Natrialba magadii ATCC 43099]|uniref:Uncharacterized protein n=1 Tax=Natrialba magadii (strain ATCC 43099 / DSM 3394 / CCM 3739 / CIP 104546 / IAM 13178 / JCM 8861 / NBRC 102185 / NCIMB 2190 / MS3) TaxID=547559 RepID=D3SQY2_NATMM|nr:hypothetical protein [Natrialba magadii]ADD06538.1 uncharacterized protein Nmag_2986 [Natrialba magadii ATCC 43099]ELY31999.1 hypothetical protein C500_05458 [Natrialba magadii ATCC 43099]
MDFRDAILGEKRPRILVLIATLLLPLFASVLFLLGFDSGLGVLLVFLSVGIAFCAGWSRAGVLSGLSVVFSSILWLFVFPPAVGYLRGSMDTRYTPPRALGYKLDPRGELIEGLTNGPLAGIVGAVLFGGMAYLMGLAVRQAIQERTADTQT